MQRINEVTKQMLTSAPANVVLAADHEERLALYCKSPQPFLYHSMPDQVRMFHKLTGQIRELPAIRSIWHFNFATAKLVSFPQNFDPSKLRLYEIDINESRYWSYFHNFNVPIGDNNFFESVVMGGALHSWICEAQKTSIDRETSSNLPQGEYVYEVTFHEYVRSVPKLDYDKVDCPLRWSPVTSETLRSSKISADPILVTINLTKTDYHSKSDKPKDIKGKGKKDKCSKSNSSASIQNARSIG